MMMYRNGMLAVKEDIKRTLRLLLGVEVEVSDVVAFNSKGEESLLALVRHGNKCVSFDPVQLELYHSGRNELVAKLREYFVEVKY